MRSRPVNNNKRHLLCIIFYLSCDFSFISFWFARKYIHFFFLDLFEYFKYFHNIFNCIVFNLYNILRTFWTCTTCSSILSFSSVKTSQFNQSPALNTRKYHVTSLYISGKYIQDFNELIKSPMYLVFLMCITVWKSPPVTAHSACDIYICIYISDGWLRDRYSALIYRRPLFGILFPFL